WRDSVLDCGSPRPFGLSDSSRKEEASRFPSAMKKLLPTVLILVCAAAFVAGIVYLLLLRFEAGDVYPPYSSLRADPLGTMALAESLAKMPGLDVRRDLSTGNKLPEEPRTTYLHLAADAADWLWLPAEIFHEMEDFATRGGRLVVTLRPVAGS